MMRIGKLSAFKSHRAVYVDWRIYDEGKRWRLQLGSAPLWFPLCGVKPTAQGRNWAFWGIGNEKVLRAPKEK